MNIAIDLRSIEIALQNPYAEYSPDGLNCYAKKQFNLNKDQYALFIDYTNKIQNKSDRSESEELQLLLLNELHCILLNSSSREYNHEFTLCDNMWLPCNMGLNACGRDTYIGVYDLSSLFPLVLATFFGTTYESILNSMNKVFSNSLDKFKFENGFGPKWFTLEKPDINKLTDININFKTFLERGSIKFKRNEFKVNNILLSNKIYSFNDAVIYSLDYYISTIFTMIENKILKQLICANSQLGFVVADHSKGFNTIVLTTGHKSLLEDFVIEYGDERIEVPYVVGTKNTIGMLYLDSKGGKLNE